MKILAQPIVALLKSEIDCLERLGGLALRIDPGGAGAGLVKDLIDHLDGLFLLVVVGEVNSGKSALINEFLQASVCPEGPIPVTDRICLLAYGDGESCRDIDPFTVERRLRHEMLKTVSVVDTPGTNSVVREHQRLTERFIPRADLVLFVTSIDRAFTESEREFLSLIRSDWHRKIFFVLTKTDTRELAEVDAVVEYVKERSREHLEFDPVVIPVSVKQARSGDVAGSGIPELRSFLQQTLSETERVRLKLSSPIEAGLKIVGDLSEMLDRKGCAIAEEAKVLDALDEELDKRRVTLHDGYYRYLSSLQDLLREFDARGRRFLMEKLRLSRLNLVGRREKFRAAFRHDVVADLEERIADLLRSGAKYLVDETEATWRSAFSTVSDGLSAIGLSVQGKHDGFTANRTQVLHQIRDHIDEAIASYDGKREADRMIKTTLRGSAGFLGIEASAATVGTILVVLAKTAVFTGVVVASAIAVSGFVLLPVARSRAVRLFSDRVDELLNQLKSSFESELQSEIERKIEMIRRSFDPCREEYELRRDQLQRLRENVAEMRRDLDALSDQIQIEVEAALAENSAPPR